MPARTVTMEFAIPPARLGHSADVYMTVEKGNTWPLESEEIVLEDVRNDLDTGLSVSQQLDAQGFAVQRHKSTTIGPLLQSEEWNDPYLQETAEMVKKTLQAKEVYIWNSVIRSADPQVNSPYGNNHFQQAPIKGLQFGTTIRPTSSGAHVDQDGDNSRRMCKQAAGDDVFERSSRVQQLNVWRPIKGPVTASPLAMCDGTSLAKADWSRHMGLFGSRIICHHGPTQRWCYISRQQPDELVWLKIFDSDDSVAPYSPHTSCDLKGSDGPAEPRESVEVRVVVVY